VTASDRAAPIEDGRTLVLAHRGDHREHPENTLDAMLAALAVPGCDGLEFDVRAARDGTPVLAHDATLHRVFGSWSRVDRLGAGELAAAGVPTFREVLDAVPARAFLDVEIKEDVGHAIVPILRGVRGPELANAVICSFEIAAVETVRRLAPDWPVWLGAMRLDADSIRSAVELGCAGLSVGHHTITAASAAAARDAGLAVAAWTVRRPRRITALARLGVAAVCVEDAALDGGRAAVAAAGPADGHRAHEEDHR
jgi:glycerophosphoryl diester phosphodiesterase